MQHCNLPSYPTSPPDDPLSLSKRQLDRRTPMRRTFARQQSTSSCVSYVSHASGSSARTHRRCRVEVSSFLCSPGRSERTTEPVDADAAKKPGSQQAAAQESPVPSRRLTSSESSIVHTERRSPGNSDNMASVSCSRVCTSSFDTLECAEHHVTQGHPAVAAILNANNNELAFDPSLRAIDMIRELSFETHLSKGTSAADSNRTVRSEDLACSSTETSLRPAKVSEDASVHREQASLQEVVAEESELPPLGPAAAPTSPPLPPKINRVESSQFMTDVPRHIAHRNRTRSTSISEMSESYFHEFGDDKELSSDDEGACTENRKSLVTIENVPPATQEDVPASLPKLSPRKPAPLWNRARSRSVNTLASQQSSYLSSSSSSSSELSLGSLGLDETTDGEPSFLLDVDNMDDEPTHETGQLSLQEGKCNSFSFDLDLSADSHELPRLDAETLRRWTAMCDEEHARDGMARSQFIFRALGKSKTLSCPHQMSLASSPGHPRRLEGSPGDTSAEEPHLVAGLSNVVSAHSLFSYTNSCADSTLSEKHALDDVISDLDFDMQFVYSYSLEKSEAERLPRSAPKGHRRSQSSSSRLGGKPLPLPKALLQHENAQGNSKQEEGRRDRRPVRKHRRFKSEGSILCGKKHILAEVNFSFSEEPSFKHKYGPRHRRGMSVGSRLEGFEFPDLGCILEEASKSSKSDDGVVVGLMGSLNPNHLIENDLDAVHVLKIGFAMGLVAGLLLPHAVGVLASSIV